MTSICIIFSSSRLSAVCFQRPGVFHTVLPQVPARCITVWPYSKYLKPSAYLSVSLPTDGRRAECPCPDSLPVRQIGPVKAVTVINELCVRALGAAGLTGRLSLGCHKGGAVFPWWQKQTKTWEFTSPRVVVIFHLPVPATSLWPILWVMGLEEVTPSTPPHLAWNVQNKRIQELHRDWTHWLDI